jgi:hypothetical protein
MAMGDYDALMIGGELAWYAREHGRGEASMRGWETIDALRAGKMVESLSLAFRWRVLDQTLEAQQAMDGVWGDWYVSYADLRHLLTHEVRIVEPDLYAIDPPEFKDWPVRSGEYRGPGGSLTLLGCGEGDDGFWGYVYALPDGRELVHKSPSLFWCDGCGHHSLLPCQRHDTVTSIISLSPVAVRMQKRPNYQSDRS